MKIVKLCCNSWAGYSEHPVELVGETPKRYRIRAINRTKLGGRCRWLARGEIALVPKRAVRVELGYGGDYREGPLADALAALEDNTNG